MPQRRWFVQRTNPEYIKYLSQSTGITPALAQILINRGIKTPESVKQFLSPDINHLIDPFDVKGIKEAVDILKDAIKDGRRILVHGDYDTDGLTATAIVVESLRSLGAEVEYFIPDRFVDGYGFSNGGLQHAVNTGTSLILTVDCGITSFDAIKKAKSEGITVIVTDHHEPKRDSSGVPMLPEADVIVNPRLDPEAPVMSGAMVAFKLCEGLLGRDEARRLLDLAALGSIADIIPLVDECRIVVKEGLSLINSFERKGIKALAEVSGLRAGNINAGVLSFTLIPRINASGRIDHARDVIQLLLTDDYDEAVSIAERLHDLNLKRQRIEEDVLSQAMEDVQHRGYDFAIVSASEGWHEGVVGIVAARLVERFYRPAFVFNIDGDIAKGSARSIPPLDLYECISRCSDLLISFGGHKQAAGLKLPVDRLMEFEERINMIISEMISDEDLIPTLTIDAAVRLKEVSFRLIQELERLEPYGAGNPEPLLGTKALEVLNPRIVGNNHLKMLLRDNSVVMDAIGFDMAERIEMLQNGRIDAVYCPSINEWEGGRFLQLKLKTFRASEN